MKQPKVLKKEALAFMFYLALGRKKTGPETSQLPGGLVHPNGMPMRRADQFWLIYTGGKSCCRV